MKLGFGAAAAGTAENVYPVAAACTWERHGSGHPRRARAGLRANAHQHAGRRAAAGAGRAGNCRSSRGGRQDDADPSNADPVLRTAPGISDNSHTRLGIGATAGSVTSWLGRTRRSRPTGAASSRIRYQTFKPLDLESGTTSLLFPQERCSFPRAFSFPKSTAPISPEPPSPKRSGPTCGVNRGNCVSRNVADNTNIVFCGKWDTGALPPSVTKWPRTRPADRNLTGRDRHARVAEYDRQNDSQPGHEPDRPLSRPRRPMPGPS